MALTGLAVDEAPHSMDGLLLHGWEGPAESGGIHKQASHG